MGVLRKTQQEYREEVSKLRQEIDEVKILLQETSAIKSEIKVAAAFAEAKRQEIANLSQAIESGQKLIADELQKVGAISEEISGMKTAAATAKKEIDTFAASGGRLKGDIEEAERKLAAATKAIDTAKDGFSEWDKEKRNEVNKFLATWDNRFKELDETITSLLPKATSAGLGESFDSRRQVYKTPRILWAILGTLSILGISAVSLWYGTNIMDIKDLHEVFVAILRKLPVALPLIFIGYYSFHQFGILSRIEEEYAHKTVLSRSFEGYKDALKRLYDDANNENMNTLTAQTLKAIAEPSANVYDTKTAPPSPIGEAQAKLLEIVGDLIKRVPQEGKPTIDPSFLPGGMSRWAMAGGGSALLGLGIFIGWLIQKALSH